jgi:trk system potassium uptake protein
VLLVIAVLPLLGLGGTQLYKAEMAGPMKEERLTPRVADTARGLWTIYLGLSLACMLAYRWAGMGWADAFMHACTTMSLGGLSPYDASLGHFDSARIEWVAVLFMALAGISFVRYFAVWSQRSWHPLWGNFEVRMYGLVLAVSTSLITLLLEVEGIKTDFWEALRLAAFHVVSIATTTGYVAADYSQWPPFVPVFLLFLGCFTSCAGSTGGGIKLIRMVILVKQAKRELVRIVHPRAVVPVTLAGEVVPPRVIGAVLAFMLFYGASLVGLTLLLLLSGMDIVTAFSAVIACVNNIGPGLGDVGPAGNYAGLSPFALAVCSFAMLLGRLELLTVLVLFSPALWKR